MIDLHLHTSISSDSSEAAKNYIKAASLCGESIIGFSDHYDYDYPIYYPPHVLPDPKFMTEQYSAAGKNNCGIKVLKGIELGYSQQAVVPYKNILKENAFDYAILSVHTVKDRGDCWFEEFFKGLSREQAYNMYFDSVLESVRSDIDFQIAAHIGYVSRNAPFRDRKIVYTQFAPILDRILKEIISRGASLEINTSVRGSGAKFIPDCDVIDRYLELGGKNLTFGSDAHKAADYLRGAEEVRRYLLSRGVKELCYYEKRQLKKYEI